MAGWVDSLLSSFFLELSRRCLELGREINLRMSQGQSPRNAKYALFLKASFLSSRELSRKIQ